MTDPQTAADAAERVHDAELVEILADHGIHVDGSCAACRGLDVALLAWREADRKRMAAELEQVRCGATLPVLRQAWLNGWSDRGRAVRDAVRASDNERAAYERAFARYMSEDPAEADKDPYRPLDGPDDPAALPTRPADGKRTPEQWCAEYGIDIADPDGWRNTGDPAWDEPITLPDFLRRAARSTTRGLTPDVWNRLSREAHEAADAEAFASAARDATERGAASEGSVS